VQILPLATAANAKLPTVDTLSNKEGRLTLYGSCDYSTRILHTWWQNALTNAKELWSFMETWFQQQGLVLNQDKNNIKHGGKC
jgi:hypothetical protein